MPLTRAAFHLGELVPEFLLQFGLVAWLTGAFQRNRAVISVISYTCAYPAMTSKNGCCEKKLFSNPEEVV